MQVINQFCLYTEHIYDFGVRHVNWYFAGVQFSYGTAGFRGEAVHLQSTVFRTGVLAALRSLSTKKATGLMITASHNPVADNGIKLADPSGGMLIMEWEAYANELAHARDSNSFLRVAIRKFDQPQKNVV